MKRLTAILLFVFVSASAMLAQDKVTIVVLGSSTAAGSGPSTKDSAWVWRYRRYAESVNPANEVINLAVGGYKTANIVTTGNQDHNITRALSYNPDGIIINLPSNDAASSIPIATQLSNYQNVMDEAHVAEVPVWVATTQPRNLSDAGRANLMAMRDSTYTIWGDFAIDFWTDLAQSDGRIVGTYNSGDGVHLNDIAHAVLVQRVIDKGILEYLGSSVGNARIAIGLPQSENSFTVTSQGMNVLFNLPQKCPADRLFVYSLSGRIAAELPISQHTVQWSPARSNAGSGAYIAMVRTSEGMFRRQFSIR